MSLSSKPQKREAPEQGVVRLVARLRHHTLWDSVLIFLPPLLVAFYFFAYGYRAGWIAPETLLFLGAAAVGVGLFAVVARYRTLIPSIGFAARLVDERTDAKDRFLTLATIEMSSQPLSFVGRLRGEAATLLERIDFRREFPYRVKRSFCWSLSGSLLVATVFYLSMPLAESSLRQASPYENLREVADKMAQRPRLSEIAQELQTLAMKLPQPIIPESEKQNLIRQALEQVENQRKKEKEKENRDLLGEALSALQTVEEQSSRRQNEAPQAGGSETKAAGEESGKGQGQQSRGSDGANKGEPGAEQGNDQQKGKGTRTDLKEQGKEKNSQADGEGRSEQPSSNRSNKDTGAEATGKKSGGSPEKLGRSRSEEPPRDAPPAERFYKPGEEGKGVKGAGYVTVQLPEELAVESKSEGTIGTPAKETKPYSKVPVSNAPLPAPVPGSPAEKQHLPLEYRGVIR